MADAMVTGRMSPHKKEAGGRVLANAQLNASQAINLLYDRLIEDQTASFLTTRDEPADALAWQAALQFVDTLPVSRTGRLDDLSSAEIRRERLTARGLMR
ncbi:MAG: RelB/DinJ family addiction module antitoxin [Eggerthellaceae bacterium]|nr:RelB/DinJ family addiction module antitoxin [Eggerthellaceae bacterium]